MKPTAVGFISFTTVVHETETNKRFQAAQLEPPCDRIVVYCFSSHGKLIFSEVTITRPTSLYHVNAHICKTATLY